MNIQLTTAQREEIAGSYGIMNQAGDGAFELLNPYPVLIPDPDYESAGSMQVWWETARGYLYIDPDGGAQIIESIQAGFRA